MAQLRSKRSRAACWLLGALALVCLDLSAEERFKKTAKPKPKEPEADFSLRTVEDVDLQAAWDRESNTRWTTPSLGVSVPGAFGADWGYLYGGIVFQNATLSGDIVDGVAFFGFGLGDARRYVGFESTLTVINLDPFGKDFGYSFKIHRMFSDTFALAAGCLYAYIHGEDAQRFEERSPYITATKIFRIKKSEFEPFSMVGINAGIGAGRFRTFSDRLANRDMVNPFASVGVRIFAPLSASVAWTGRDIDIGLSFTPFRSFRMAISPTVVGLRETVSKRLFALAFTFGDSVFESTFPFFSQSLTR